MTNTNSNSPNILSKRSLNIVERLGGVPGMLEYYSSGRSFLSLRNSGRKTELELIALCESLVGKKKLKGSEIEDNGTCFIVEDINSAFNQYHIYKALLSSGIQKYLTALEESFLVSLNESQKHLFIATHFNPDFQFIRKSSFTESMMKELERLKHRMLPFVKKESHTENIDVELIDIVREKPRSANFKFNYVFPNELSPSEIKIFFDGQKYDLANLVSATLHLGKWSKKQSLIIHNFYFTENLLSIKEIAKLSSCSEQLVRTFIDKLDSEFLPKSIEDILSEVSFEELDYCYSENKDWFVAEPFKFFALGESLLTPNYRLGFDSLKAFYAGKFSIVQDLFDNALIQNRTFEFADGYLFISMPFIKKVKLTELLVFLEKEIYEFESVRFNYNLFVLIERFYKENGVAIEKNDIESVYKIISRIKLQEIRISKNIIKKNERKMFINQVSDIIEAHLISCNQAQRTKDLLTILKGRDIEIDRAELLLILKNRSEIFARIGNGLCGLKIWSSEENLQGSIREIVEHKLSDIETPLHITEIMGLLSDFRDISKHSLLTNLKLSENKVFRFFNCSFIGLNRKKYNEYWEEIPKFVPTKFMGVFRDNSLSYEMKIKKLVEFGYPEIHARSVLDSKMQETSL